MAQHSYRVSVHVDCPRARVDRRALAVLARRVLAAEDAPSPAGLSVVLTDDETVRALNKRYLGIDAPTDVLSFAMTGPGFVSAPVARPVLGEVIISYPTARAQATQTGHLLRDELAHLLVHGVLHLLGWDHGSAAGARRMREREEELLGAAVRHNAAGSD